MSVEKVVSDKVELFEDEERAGSSSAAAPRRSEAWWTRIIARRCKALDLRFPDLEEERLFKAGLELDLLRWMLFGSAVASVCTILNSIMTFGPELYSSNSQHSMFDLSDARNRVFFAQLGLWTIAPAIFGVLISLRLFLSMFSAWNWEAVVTVFMMYGSVVIVVGQLYHLTVMFGGDPNILWRTDVSRSAEAWVLLGLNTMTNAAAFFLPLRSIMSWTVPVLGLLTYSALRASIDSDRQAADISVKTLLMIALSYLAWHGSARTEKHLRTEWRAKRELVRASEQIEQQQVAIQAKGRELLEKDATVKETMELMRSLQTVARALCDTMVHLTADMRIRNIDSDISESFFERDVEGRVFTELLSEGDQARFAACMSRAAQSNIPVCLPVTLHKKYTTSEVHLVLVHRGNTELRYLIGIRVEKDSPYTLPVEDAARKSVRGSSGGGGKLPAAGNQVPAAGNQAQPEVPGFVPDARKVFSTVVPGVPRQIQSIDEDNESDFSFTTYPKNDLPRPPKFTNFRARARTIRMILKRWFVPRDCESCCQYHTVLDSIDEAVDCLRQQKCDPLWSTYSEQCPRCACMNQGAKCVVCGHAPDNQRAASGIGAPRVGGGR